MLAEWLDLAAALSLGSVAGALIALALGGRRIAERLERLKKLAEEAWRNPRSANLAGILEEVAAIDREVRDLVRMVTLAFRPKKAGGS
jgi:hypothetical protein